jgi:hypothetical protein
LEIGQIDLQDRPEQEREVAARNIAREDLSVPFDLARGPLIRAKLLRLGNEEHVLLVNMHHIVSDAWSIGIMVREIAQLYEAARMGKDAGLPELKIQYGDYAEWQREWLQGEVLEGQIEYWRKQLEGVRELELGTDRARPAVMSQRGAMYSFTVAEDMLRKVEELSQREGVTLYMTLLAALQVVLWRYSGQEDIAVGTPVAGRKRTETEGLIGFFINTLVLRTRMRGEWSFRELLGEVRERTLEAYEHQDVPFEKLVDELEVERDMSRTPLFQVAMVLQNAGQEELQLGGLEVEEYSLAEENRTAKFDLTWGLWESGRGLQGGVEYNTDLYERETVARMVERWQGVLEQGVESGEGMEKEESYAQLVARRAAAEPEKIAVVGEGGRLTFGEMNRQGEQWGHYLKKQGVKAGTRVGVCLEGVEAWAVAILGVMKAGGVVVGLCGEESRERLARMVESSQTGLVITEERQAGLFGDGVRLLLLEEEQRKVEQESEEGDGEREGGSGGE